MKTSWISSQSARDYSRGGASRDRRKFLKARIEPSSPWTRRPGAHDGIFKSNCYTLFYEPFQFNIVSVKHSENPAAIYGTL